MRWFGASPPSPPSKPVFQFFCRAYLSGHLWALYAARVALLGFSSSLITYLSLSYYVVPHPNPSRPMLTLDLSSLSDSVTFQLTGISSADNLDTLFSSLSLPPSPPPSPAAPSRCRRCSSAT